MKVLYDYSMQMVGVPYKWGGSNPIQGMDCSALVQELLLAAGGHPSPTDDFTAQRLFDYFSQPDHHVSREMQLGALVFYGSLRSSIIHVGMCLDEKKMIEAGGGGRRINTREDAALFNAFVRVRPIRQGASFQGCFMPLYYAAKH